MLLADKTIGRFVPVRFLTFSVIGGLGIFVHMIIVVSLLKGLHGLYNRVCCDRHHDDLQLHAQ